MTNTFKFFKTREEYINFRTAWKALANSKQANFSDHIVYALIKGMPLNKIYTPISNKTKLECNCGGNPYHFFDAALNSLKYRVKNYKKGSYTVILDSLSDEDRIALLTLIENVTLGKE